MDSTTERIIDTVTIGDELPSIALPVTLQRLVIEAGANRDFSLIHHDRDVARATGAPDAYMNTFFIVGMFERLLREWMGDRGRIQSIKNLRMKIFNAVGDTVTFRGRVDSVDASSGQVHVDLWSETDKGQTVTAVATIELPA